MGVMGLCSKHASRHQPGALHGCARHVWTARTAGMASAGGGGAHLLEEVARLILQQPALLHDVVEQLARLRARARGVRAGSRAGRPGQAGRLCKSSGLLPARQHQPSFAFKPGVMCTRQHGTACYHWEPHVMCTRQHGTAYYRWDARWLARTRNTGRQHKLAELALSQQGHSSVTHEEAGATQRSGQRGAQRAAGRAAPRLDVLHDDVDVVGRLDDLVQADDVRVHEQAQDLDLAPHCARTARAPCHANAAQVPWSLGSKHGYALQPHSAAQVEACMASAALCLAICPCGCLPRLRSARAHTRRYSTHPSSALTKSTSMQCKRST